MSKKDKTDDTPIPGDEDLRQDVLGAEEPAPAPDAEAEPEPEAEAEAEPEPEPEPEPEASKEAQVMPEAKPARKSGAGVAWLAVFLSFVALAAVGYTIAQDWRNRSSESESGASLERSVAGLRDRVEASDETLGRLEKGLGELGQAGTSSTAELAELRRDLDTRAGLFDSLPPRMSNLENTMSALQGVSAGARDTWLLAEAEYYMQIANAQLQLAGNPHLAALALGMADERVLQLANPALTDVRRTLSDELAALELMDKPDIEGVTLTIASLARVVDSLPLREQEAAQAESAAATDDGTSGVDRAWSSVKGAVSGLVKVTPTDQTSMPLIAPDAVYFLRTNLALQLQTAKLALLRGEKAVFEQSLDDAAAWLQQYFDVDSAQVTSVLQTIDEIRGGMFSVTPPDISESLRLLRQFKTLSETAQ
jgi:uncharacterized protein HemX